MEGPPSKKAKLQATIAKNISKTTIEEELLRKYSSELSSAMLHPVEVSHKFYSAKFIDKSTQNKVTKHHEKSCEGAANVIMVALQAYVRCCHHTSKLRDTFLEILQILKEYTPLDCIVKTIESQYHQGDPSVEDEEPMETTESSNPHLASLKTALQVYSNDLNISGISSKSAIDLMKSRIENHIHKSLEDGTDCEVVRRQLNDLIMNALIPVDINSWCFEKLEEIQKSLEPPSEVSPFEDTDEPACDLPPLFSKDTVFHASLCLSIVSSAVEHPNLSAADLKRQFDKHGHNFDEISLSVVDKNSKKSLIAKQGNIYYVALGIKNCTQAISEDPEKHLSDIPLRYFTELLNQGKRLVFTGFSVGALLALCLCNELWQLPYFNAEMLSQNVSCIMFAPVLVKEYILSLSLPETSKWVHSFLLKNDFVLKPSLFRHVQEDEPSEIYHEYWLLAASSHLCADLPSHILDHYYGSTYMINQNVDGSYWEKLESPAEELKHLTRDLITKLTPLHFQQHNMQTYQLNILRGYLDKEPRYKIPKRKSRGSIPYVQSLKPTISKVEIHCQQHPDGKEYSFAFKGDNLWFCSEITVSLGRMKPLRVVISAKDVSQKQLQYCHGVDKKFNVAEIDHSKYVEVAIESLFHISSNKVQMTFNEPDPISFRQSQLARQTPSQIIQLAFLSALLELAPHNQGAISGCPSQRYQLITKFLQEAARIVPMESIFIAIADCTSDTTAIKCAEALITSNTLIPCSKLMKIGCRKAVEKFIRFHPYSRYYHGVNYMMSAGLSSSFSSNTRGLNMTDTDDDIAVSSLTVSTHNYDDILSFHDVYQLGNYPISSQYSSEHHFANNNSLKKHKQLSGSEETQSTVFYPLRPLRRSPRSLRRSTKHRLFIGNTSKKHKQPSGSEQTQSKVVHSKQTQFQQEHLVPIHTSPSESTVFYPSRSLQYSPNSLQYSTQDHDNTSKKCKQISGSEQTQSEVMYPSEYAVPIHASPSESTVFYPSRSLQYSPSSLQYSTQDHDNTSKKCKQISGSEQTQSEVMYPSEYAVPIHTSPSTLFGVCDFCIQLDRRFNSSAPRDLICGRNIGETYPISECLSNTQSYNVLKPLPVILREARQVLASLCVEHKVSDKNIGATSSGNCRMLDTVNSIIANNLEPCVAMLGGFMEQQIRIPLVNNPKDTAKAFATADNSGAVGVWALFALEKVDIVKILDTRRSQTLVLQITDFIHGALNADTAKCLDIDKLSSYDGKLQFLLQGMSETVTCSSHYISYSLERELVRLCDQLEITTSTNVDEVIATWDEKFNQTALALVPTSHRPLLARWLIWALNIYRLREGLAKYTTVGVIGLVNSGKSTLVKKLFQKETVAGTTQSARTTVPFIYNMDDSVEGLSVIDFPGVDDRDESIKGLAQLLVGLAQVVIFVCGYERFHTASAEEWMQMFCNELISIPVLVCLTHADDLYENCKEDIVPICPKEKVKEMEMKFNSELEQIIRGYPQNSNCTVKFCSLIQRIHSPLNCHDGRESMRKVGIYTPEDIGQWIKEVMDNELQQPDLAERLEDFLIKTT